MESRMALKLLPAPDANTQMFNWLFLAMQINQIRIEIQFNQFGNWNFGFTSVQNVFNPKNLVLK